MPFTLKVTADNNHAKGPIVGHLFDARGNLVERAEVKEGALRLDATEKQVEAGTLLLSPDLGEHPTRARLDRARAFDPSVGLDELPSQVTVPNNVLAIWPWCWCLVRGTVVRTDDRPICGARVHVCEVDAIPLIIARLPDRDLLRLRDDLLDLVDGRVPISPPIPDPRPDPDPFFPSLSFPGDQFAQPVVPDLPRAGQHGPVTRLPVVARTSSTRLLDATVRVRLNPQTEIPGLPRLGRDEPVRMNLQSRSPMVVRKQLVERPLVLIPWLCFIPWLWPLLRCDEVAVVATDDAGRFQALVPHDCGDTPDLYFWVEFDLGDGWETVHRPPLRCNVHWNHDCDDEVTITVTDPRVPACGPGNLGNHDVNILSLGHQVAVNEIHPATAADSLAGRTTDGAPFGHTIEPRVDFAPTLLDAGIAFHRWSYRRLSGPDGVDPSVPAGSQPTGTWEPLTRPVYRHYREVTSGGTSYPALLLGPLPESEAPAPNLFAIPEALTPAGDGQWRVLDEHEDLASGHFETTKLPGAPIAATDVDLSAGRYELKLELFRDDGDLVNWSDAGIEPGITDQPAPFGTGVVTTDPAPSHNRVLVGGDTMGFRMVLRVDNNRCTAQLHPVTGDVTPDPDCGFHTYASTTDGVGLQFTAGHPNALATYVHAVVRGATTTVAAGAAGGDVGTAGTDGWTHVGGSSYTKEIPVSTLVGDCPSAAFAETLRVLTRAQNGYTRLSGYDAFAVAGFALTPDS